MSISFSKISDSLSKRMALHFLMATVFFCCSAQLLAQNENPDTAVFRRIREAELSSSQIPRIAHYLTDVSGSRLTNSPGFTRAGTWAIETMKSWGLQNAGFEAWGEYGRGWEPEYFNISMKVPYSAYVIGYPLPWSSNTNGEIQAPVFVMPYYSIGDSAYIASHQADFKGKIVLLTVANLKHGEDFKPFSTRYTDSELLKMPDTEMLTRSQLAFYLTYFAKAEKGKLAIKSYGALAIVTAGRGGRDGTVTVQNFSAFKTGSAELLP